MRTPESLWLRTVADPGFPPLTGDTSVDVCVVGGGIAGVTAARLLQRLGKRVALLDQGRIGNGVTGYTTAHLTDALDTRWFELRKTFGNDGARLAAHSHRAAIDYIARTVDEEKLDCGFRHLPGYLYSEESSDQIVREHEAARACGIEVTLIEGLFWDDSDPYHYLRMQDEQLIAGGEDHKVGQRANTNESYARLREYVRARFDAPVESQWSAQIVEPVDGLPYIGRNSLDLRVFIATGFSGNGMTGGTLAAMLLADLVLGKSNDWESLYKATRLSAGAAVEWTKENVDYPLHLVVDALKRAPASTLDSVARGEGRIVTVAGKKVAASRDEDGKLTLLSPICTHMACTVRWNAAEKSWDCPCHGARHDVDGDVLNGPAIKPLAKKQR